MCRENDAMMLRMRTTVTFDDEIVLALRRIQKKRPEESFKTIVNQILKKGLSVEGEMVNVPFKVEPGHDAKPRPGVNYDKISELISIAEGDSHK